MANDKKNIYDLIIVGQGLAGTSIAWHAHFKDKKILIIDNPIRNISSSIAAGIFHPLASRTYGVSWMADEFFPYLLNFYPRIERLSNSSFFHLKSYFRPFLSTEEKLSHINKITDNPYLSIVEHSHNSICLKNENMSLSSPSSTDIIKDHTIKDSQTLNYQWGGVEVKDAGYLDINKYIKATSSYFSNRDSYLSSDFEYSKLEIGNNIYNYKGYKSRSIVFCEGVNIIKNPFFTDVEIIPNKGEIIHGEIEGSIDKIYSRKVFVLPIINNDHKSKVIIGATYDKNDISLTNTPAGRDYLLMMYERLLPYKLDIDNMQVGLRPTTKDRRPILSQHNKYQNMYLLNGLGSKGVSLAPLMGRKFIERCGSGNLGLSLR